MVSNINVCRYSPYFIFNKSVGRNVSITVKPLCFYVSGKYNSWIICRKSFDYIMRPRENTKIVQSSWQQFSRLNIIFSEKLYVKKRDKPRGE